MTTRQMAIRTWPAVVLLAVALLPTEARADVPDYVTYSARLSDGTGWGQSSVADLEFTLYEESGDGSGLWTQSFTAVPLDNGYFSIVLGEGTDPVDGGPVSVTRVMADHDALWIAVAVDGGPQLTPRQQIGAVPYAVQARRARRTVDRVGDRRISLSGLYAGRSAASTTGLIAYQGLIGYRAAKAICEQDMGSPTAHMCNSLEMVNSAQLGLLSYTSAVWVASGTMAFDIQLTPGGQYQSMTDCEGWTKSVFSNCDGVTGKLCFGAAWSVAGHYYPAHGYCDTLLYIACCD